MARAPCGSWIDGLLEGRGWFSVVHALITGRVCTVSTRPSQLVVHLHNGCALFAVGLCSPLGPVKTLQIYLTSPPVIEVLFTRSRSATTNHDNVETHKPQRYSFLLVLPFRPLRLAPNTSLASYQHDVESSPQHNHDKLLHKSEPYLELTGGLH